MDYNWAGMAKFIENERKSLLVPMGSMFMLFILTTFVAPLIFMSQVSWPLNIAIAALVAITGAGVLISWLLQVRRKDRELKQTLHELDGAPEDFVSVDPKILRLHQGDPVRLRGIRELTTEKLEVLQLNDVKLAILWISMSAHFKIERKAVALHWQGVEAAHDTYLYQDFFSDPIERLLDNLALNNIRVLVAWSGHTKFDPRQDLRRIADGEEPQYLLAHHNYIPGRIYSISDYFSNKKF
jgi:hypothetical protein